MEIHACRQAVVFLAATASGLCIGAVYDFLKLVRRSLHAGNAAVVFTDILFWIISAVFVFGVNMAVADGEIRVFQLVGAVLGAIIFFSALSKPFEKLFSFLASGFRLALKFILLPFVFIFNIIRKVICVSEKRCGKLGFIIMFYHSKLRKNINLIKKIRKST